MSRWDFKSVEVKDLLGKTLVSVEKDRTYNNDSGNNDRLIFTTNDGEEYQMYHDQDCCESVTLEDIAGYLEDLIGSPLTMAEEVVLSLIHI